MPIGQLVQLDNTNIGGESTFLWAILDQPPGTNDVLSDTGIQNPTFTTNKEGTYLIRLVVNSGLSDEQIDTAVVAVRQLKTRERIPAAGETTEDDTADGWALSMNELLRRIDSQLSDPGIIVGVNASGGVLARGTVLRVTSGQVIKSGLPGQETVPGFTPAVSTSAGNVDELLCVLEGSVDGSANPVDGAIVAARYIGRIASVTLSTGAVGDTVYVSDSGLLSTTPGTVRRQVGSIMAVGVSTRDVWFDGVGGVDITPIDRAYVLYGAPSSGMLNAVRVDGPSAGGAINSRPWTFRAADNATVAAVSKRFSQFGQDIHQFQDENGVILAKVSNNGSITTTGTLTATGAATVGSLSTSGAVTASGTVTGGSFSTAGSITANGAISGGSLSVAGAIAAGGSVSAASFTSPGNIYISGPLYAGGQVTGGKFITSGTLDVIGTSTLNRVVAGQTSATSFSCSGAVSGTTGSFTSISTGNINSTGNLTLSGAIGTGGAVNAGGAVTGASAAFTGQCTAGSFGDVNCSSLTTSGVLTVNGTGASQIFGSLTVNGLLSSGRVWASGNNTNGYSLIAQNDSLAWSPFHITSSGSAPTRRAVGDLYVTSAGVLMINNGSAWVSVGSQS